MNNSRFSATMSLPQFAASLISEKVPFQQRSAKWF